MFRPEDPTGNRGSEVLLITKLNQEDTEHWSLNVQVTHEVGHAMPATLRKIPAPEDTPLPIDSSKPSSALGEPLIDGETKVALER